MDGCPFAPSQGQDKLPQGPRRRNSGIAVPSLRLHHGGIDRRRTEATSYGANRQYSRCDIRQENDPATISPCRLLPELQEVAGSTCHPHLRSAGRTFLSADSSVTG